MATMSGQQQSSYSASLSRGLLLRAQRTGVEKAHLFRHFGANDREDDRAGLLEMFPSDVRPPNEGSKSA